MEESITFQQSAKMKLSTNQGSTVDYVVGGVQGEPESVRVGAETVNELNEQEENSFTNRGNLKPKYSHRKNNQHLMKMAGPERNRKNGEGTNTDKVSVDQITRHIGLLTDNMFNGQGGN